MLLRAMERIGKARRNFKSHLLLMTSLILSTLFLFQIVTGMQKTYAIYDGGEVLFISTFEEDLDKILQENGIILSDGDAVVAAAQNKNPDIQAYTIRRQFPVFLICDGTVFVYSSYGENESVVSLLERNKQTLSPADIVDPPLTAAVEDGMIITITRVTYGDETVLTDIPFDTVVISDESLDYGRQVRDVEGVAGEYREDYTLVYHDGKLAERILITEAATAEPVDEVYRAGMGGSVTARDGTVYKWKKKLTVTATAYSPDCDGGIVTAIGTRARVGAIAVDPKVIPLGSRLYITSADGKSWVYGYAVAEDTGGAIKGNRIDLFFNTLSEANSFGRKKAIVYVLL